MIIRGDSLEAMACMERESIDAVVTDPPYGLKFLGHKWDHGIPSKLYWRAAFRAAKPGANLLAFGGTKTFHRLTCAIEDAGWEIRDCLSWLYGQGMPHSKQLLKPGWEPIVMARKVGHGHLNIDACRIGTTKEVPASKSRHQGYSGGWAGESEGTGGFDPKLGRWPANVVIDGGVAAAIDAQSGISKSTGGRIGKKPGGGIIGRFCPEGKYSKGDPGYGNTGGASRFFYCSKPRARERGEGNDHPTVKPTDLMRWLIRLASPEGGLVLDPFAGSGTTGVAALAEGRRFIGIEINEHYADIAESRLSIHRARS